ncbi:hypothetical protein BJ917_1138 [Pseudomonas sp. WPR_5_2]|nr:hypothetical protein BJ917_1137 [Pseudomonas sp. WPR_5_2]RKS28266.1 hypothetical protein BJ917_1138 [Pseudomonas sp. WPR_5_2]
MTDTPLSPTEFEAALRAKGAYYHIHHPYHVAISMRTRQSARNWSGAVWKWRMTA